MNEQEPQITHLERRKIEGRVLIPFIEACRERFGEAATRELVMTTIRRIAEADGAKWATALGAGLPGLKRVAEEIWAGGGGMDIDIITDTSDRLEFNVTRCGYAAFYQELGLADLGALILCCRDQAMVEGFDREVEFARSGTLMEGKSCCDFRFRTRAD